MKLLLAIALSVAATGSAAAAPTSLAGKWNVHSTIGGTDSDTVCTFVQTQKALSGSCSTPDQGDKKLTGVIDATKVTWSIETEYNGSPLTVKYVGTIDEKTMKITGTASVEQFGVEGDFSAVPVK